MNQCGFCGRSDQPMWLNDAASIRCKDAADCDSFRRQRGKTALRDPAGKPSARRSGPPAPDSAKAAHFEARAPVSGSASTGGWLPPAAKVIPRRKLTAEDLLNGLDEYSNGAEIQSKAADQNPLTPTQEAAWRMLEASVASGNVEAMNAALLTFCEAAGVDLGKSHRLTAAQILNGEVLPYEGPRYKRGGPTAEQILNGEGAAHKWSVTVTGEDEDEEMDDDATEAGAAPNLALTADQQMYWERLQSVVSGSGGISDSLETAARNFYNSVSVAV